MNRTDRMSGTKWRVCRMNRKTKEVVRASEACADPKYAMALVDQNYEASDEYDSWVEPEHAWLRSDKHPVGAATPFRIDNDPPVERTIWACTDGTVRPVGPSPELVRKPPAVEYFEWWVRYSNAADNPLGPLRTEDEAEGYARKLRTIYPGVIFHVDRITLMRTS